MQPIPDLQLLRLLEEPLVVDVADQVRGGVPGELPYPPPSMVEHLSERLPQIAEIKAEQSWEQRQARPDGAPGRSLVTLIEAVLV